MEFSGEQRHVPNPDLSRLRSLQVESAHLLPVAMVNAFGQTAPALTTAAEIYQASVSGQIGPAANLGL